jgi:hypothetical protein
VVDAGSDESGCVGEVVAADADIASWIEIAKWPSVDSLYHGGRTQALRMVFEPTGRVSKARE